MAYTALNAGKSARSLRKQVVLNDIRERAASGNSEDRFQILHHTLGLLRDAAFHDGHRGWIERDLAGGKEEAIGGDGL